MRPEPSRVRRQSSTRRPPRAADRGGPPWSTQRRRPFEHPCGRRRTATPGEVARDQHQRLGRVLVVAVGRICELPRRGPRRRRVPTSADGQCTVRRPATRRGDPVIRDRLQHRCVNRTNGAVDLDHPGLPPRAPGRRAPRRARRAQHGPPAAARCRPRPRRRAPGTRRRRDRRNASRTGAPRAAGGLGSSETGCGRRVPEDPATAPARSRSADCRRRSRSTVRARPARSGPPLLISSSSSSRSGSGPSSIVGSIEVGEWRGELAVDGEQRCNRVTRETADDEREHGAVAASRCSASSTRIRTGPRSASGRDDLVHAEPYPPVVGGSAGPEGQGRAHVVGERAGQLVELAIDRP